MKFISFARIAVVVSQSVLLALLATSCVDSAGLDAGGGGAANGGDETGGSGGSGNKKIIPGTGGGGGGTGCGPVCEIFCEFGNVADEEGCPTCSCNPAPVCDAIACANICPNGFVKGATGCPTCQCQDPIVCPAIACIAIACPNGNQVDRNGCPTCGCDSDPVCDCRNAPIPNIACASGATPPLSCERNSAGQCFWKIGACPMCSPVACDIACQFGHATDANGCELCRCNPEPQECQPAECGVQTLIVAPIQICEDGTTAGRQCRRNTDGKCSWQFTSCPQACRDLPDLKTCETVTRCRWLEPGCDGVKLPAAGCFPRAEVGCQSSADCNGGRTCQKRSVNPCANANCLACAQPITVCL